MLITNSLTCWPFQGSRPRKYYSYQRYNGDYDQCQPRADREKVRGRIDKDKTEHVTPGMRPASPAIPNNSQQVRSLE